MIIYDRCDKLDDNNWQTERIFRRNYFAF